MTDLFGFPENRLPHDGEVLYEAQFLSVSQAERYLAQFITDIDWQHDEALIYGKHIITRRKVAWYGDQPFRYTYSKRTRIAKPWTDALGELKRLVEDMCGVRFNACLMNLYHDGDDGMAWHSDDERELVPQGVIASVSLGAERRFKFKHKTTGQVIALQLEHGSLLQMKGLTQTHWLHELPKSRKITTPRINLTFRQMRAQR